VLHLVGEDGLALAAAGLVAAVHQDRDVLVGELGPDPGQRHALDPVAPGHLGQLVVRAGGELGRGQAQSHRLAAGVAAADGGTAHAALDFRPGGVGDARLWRRDGHLDPGRSGFAPPQAGALGALAASAAKPGAVASSQATAASRTFR
jgi:hypothetical protein